MSTSHGIHEMPAGSEGEHSSSIFHCSQGTMGLGNARTDPTKSVSVDKVDATCIDVVVRQ